MPRRRNGGATYKPTSSVIRAVAPGNGMQTVSAMPTGLFLIAATVASNAWPRSRRQPAAVAVINGASPCCCANARAIYIKTGMSLMVAERNFNTVLSLSSIVSMPQGHVAIPYKRVRPDDCPREQRQPIQKPAFVPEGEEEEGGDGAGGG